LVTYNKQKWEHDLLKDLKITYGFKCTAAEFSVQ